MRIIRVFPRRTSYTPKDQYAFVGDPPFWRPKAEEVHISCTFTWDLKESYRLRDAWADYYEIVKIGGLAIDGTDHCGEFVPGRYVKKGVTFTSRGCPRKCPWCFVPQREGKLRLLAVKPGWMVNDNNLLACPKEHQLKVYGMLRVQYRPISFQGGLDTRLVDKWVADQLKELEIYQVFLAADTEASLKPLRQAAAHLSFLKRRQLRCYVLIGFNGETIDQAEKRLEAVWDAGCLPFAQLYRSPGDKIKWDKDWRQLAKFWSRPAATKAIMKQRRSGRDDSSNQATEGCGLPRDGHGNGLDQAGGRDDTGGGTRPSVSCELCRDTDLYLLC